MHCGSPGTRRERERYKRILELIMSKNLPNLIKDRNINIQEAQTASKMNSETHINLNKMNSDAHTEIHYNKTVKRQRIF